jgi:isocitrate dehydrogenase
MKLVVRPHEFDVIVMTNLQGDIISDLCAGLVGGLGFAPSANIGDHIAIFEAVHGTAPDIQGKNIANPTALLLSGITMLRHLGLMQGAAIIENALLYTLEQGTRTGDFGDKTKPSSNTIEFANAIVNNFGQLPSHNPKPLLPDMPATPTSFKLQLNSMMENVETTQEEIVGVDMFIESNEQPNVIADKCLNHTLNVFKLVTISNRGTQVWPKGSVFTNLVNTYACRFESIGDSPVTQTDILELYKRLTHDFKICSTELLNITDGKKCIPLRKVSKCNY